MQRLTRSISKPPSYQATFKTSSRFGAFFSLRPPFFRPHSALLRTPCHSCYLLALNTLLNCLPFCPAFLHTDMANTTLPSFVDLMSSLGLDQTTHQPELPSSSPIPSPTSSAFLPRKAPECVSRVRSQPSLRDRQDAARVPRVSRYSPYTSMVSLHLVSFIALKQYSYHPVTQTASRRGSTSSTSALSPDNNFIRVRFPVVAIAPENVCSLNLDHVVAALNIASS